MATAVEEIILFDIGNGSKSRSYIKDMYGTYGLTILSNLVTFGRIKVCSYMGMDLKYHTSYNLA